MKTLIVNFYGGPGTGKSTMSARVFSELKERNWNVELATEYAKELTWQESFNVLSDQIYVFGKQQHRIWRLDGKVQVIITDSPLLFSLVYGKEVTSIEFKKLVQSVYLQRPTIDIYLNRVKPYNPIGRSQSEQEARVKDLEIKQIVEDFKGAFNMYIDGDKSSTETIVNYVMEEYNKLNKIEK